ncbi:PepSY domain-containing protein [Alsobacter sp. KACC 23698]|uniref:PepSY domain-containing protein n=1 Tax=Alsobacter sp. KACC 23698 TaxID=3149229 RepID=A0AAU7JGH5_9HYPH
MRKIIPLAGVLAAAVAFIPAAQASSLGRPCTAAPESQWLSLEALKAKAQDQGYKVQKAKLKAACGEVYVLDAKGARVELFLDPTSGAIVAQE